MLSFPHVLIKLHVIIGIFTKFTRVCFFAVVVSSDFDDVHLVDVAVVHGAAVAAVAAVCFAQR